MKEYNITFTDEELGIINDFINTILQVKGTKDMTYDKVKCIIEKIRNATGFYNNNNLPTFITSFKEVKKDDTN